MEGGVCELVGWAAWAGWWAWHGFAHVAAVAWLVCEFLRDRGEG